MKRITIIGSGMAAAQLVRDIRKKEIEQHYISIISPNLCHTYAKPQLSMLWRMKKQPDSVINQEHNDFCHTFNIDYIQGSVAHIDSKNQNITLDNGDNHIYDILVMANGARPLLPYANTDYLFDYDSCKTLHSNISLDSKVAIIGGGLIGCEIADDLSHKLPGKSITLFSKKPRLLDRYVPPQISKLLLETLEDREITIIQNTKEINVEKQGDQFTVTTEDQLTDQYDCVISALGMSVEDLNLPKCSINNTYKANNQLEIEKNIYGLGDCVSVDGVYKPYIQPMIYQSNILSNILVDYDGPKKISYPVFTVNIKTPSCPIAIIGSIKSQGMKEYKELSHGVILVSVENHVQQIILCGQDAMRQKLALQTQYEKELMLATQ